MDGFSPISATAGITAIYRLCFVLLEDIIQPVELDLVLEAKNSWAAAVADGPSPSPLIYKSGHVIFPSSRARV
jgi:hypothetical protein